MQRRGWGWGLAAAGLLLVLVLTVPTRGEFAEWLADYRTDHGQAAAPAGELPNLSAYGGDARAQNYLILALFYVRDEPRKRTPLVAVGILRQIIRTGAVPELPQPTPAAPNVTPLYVPPRLPNPSGLPSQLDPAEAPYGQNAPRPFSAPQSYRP